MNQWIGNRYWFLVLFDLKKKKSELMKSCVGFENVVNHESPVNQLE